MRLYLDAGNTRIKWQLRRSGNIVASGAGNLEADGLFEQLDAKHWQAVERVAVSTVRSETAREDLALLIEGRTGAPVTFYWTRRNFGDVSCSYAEPKTMGSDRWHALIGAWERVAGECVVVDAGSAITIDWLDEHGRHRGGYILPGRGLMLRSLQRSTARVQFDMDNPSSEMLPGRTTDECVFHGINWLLSLISAGLAQTDSAPVVVTGGDGCRIKEALEGASGEAKVIYCPDLVIEGLVKVDESS